ELVDADIRDLKESVFFTSLILTLDPIPVFKATTRGPERGPLPPLGHALRDARVLVAREPVVDKPLAVEQPRRIFEKRHPPPVVLDEVVVGGEDVGDAPLNRDGRDPNRQVVNVIPIEGRIRVADVKPLEVD